MPIAENATHDDILFAPHKTPEIRLKQARMLRDGKIMVLIENYEPAEYMNSLDQVAAAANALGNQAKAHRLPQPVLNPYESEKLLAEYLLFHYGSETGDFGADSRAA